MGEGYKVALKEAKPYPPGQSLLTKVKDAPTMEKLSKVVHWVPCSCGRAYIRETAWRPKIRMKEDRDACQKGALEKSALAEHAWENHHSVVWEETSVVDQARSPKELLLKEAIHIRLLTPPTTSSDTLSHNFQ